jgi:ABC-2 type transport system ATP-binding protein
VQNAACPLPFRDFRGKPPRAGTNRPSISTAWYRGPVTASLPVPNDIDPEEPDRHTSARVVRLPDTVKPASEKPRKPGKPRKGGSSEASSAPEPGPPPLPSDLARAASAAAGIVVPPRPPLPASDAEAPAPAVTPEAASVITDPDRRPVSDVSALELRGVTKSFGATLAVDGIDLTVPAGTFYGLVGPNGAGKTTTLSIIAGLLVPDRGTIRVGGIDAAAEPLAAKRLMGVLPDRLRTFDRLTGRQLLYYYGVLRKLPPAVVESRTADLARAFDLEDALGRSVSDYSAGMLKKVMLAGALIHSPRLLVLDEPFEAVDPVSSAIILDILSTYVAHGGTVVLSSHGMELVERVCSRVAVIVAGQVLAEGSVEEVRGELTLEQRFVELAGGLSDVEGLEWLHTFSD